jgi:hypothetical protein
MHGCYYFVKNISNRKKACPGTLEPTTATALSTRNLEASVRHARTVFPPPVYHACPTPTCAATGCSGPCPSAAHGAAPLALPSSTALCSSANLSVSYQGSARAPCYRLHDGSRASRPSLSSLPSSFTVRIHYTIQPHCSASLIDRADPTYGGGHRSS